MHNIVNTQGMQNQKNNDFFKTKLLIIKKQKHKYCIDLQNILVINQFLIAFRYNTSTQKTMIN